MAFTHLAFLDTATQIAVGEWRGDSEKLPVAPTGRTAVDITGLVVGLGEVSGRHWNGTSFDAVPAARLIRPGQFFARFTDAEYIALDDHLDAKLTGYKQIRLFFRRLQDAGIVDLDSADMTTFLTFLVGQGLLTAQRATAIRG